MPISAAINWSDFAAHTDLDQWYLVVFRSTRKPEANDAKLDALGEAARQDASRQPGYLFYFRGNVLEGTNKLKNLSFCMWRSRSEAEAAAKRQLHQTAITAGIGMYQEYIVERYNARVNRDGGRARIQFTALTS